MEKFEMANSTVDMMPGGLESDEESSPFETSVIIPNSVLNALLIPICIELHRWQRFGASCRMEKSFPTHSVYHFAVQSCCF